MGKLIFYFGAMGCSKTANALMTRFQYIERGKSVLLMKPATDNRDDIINDNGTITTIIKSRVGIQAEALAVNEQVNLFELYQTMMPDIIICDEAQFLTEKQVEELRDISDLTKTKVVCYGLRTDFKTRMFPGSKRLFELADEVTALDAVCDCGKNAIVNARFDKNGKLVTHGAQIEIGGNERYKALCWTCYKRGQL